MLHMSAQCYEHRFGYCTNANTCFNVHCRPILAERRVLLGYEVLSPLSGKMRNAEYRKLAIGAE